MDQVDSILFITLRQLGVKPLLDNPKIKSCRVMTPPLILAAVSKLLALVKQNATTKAQRELGDYPDLLPETTSKRFKLFSNISRAIIRLGYTEQIGYHQFLYPTETSTRSVLRWLLELVPRDDDDDEADDLSATSELDISLIPQTELYIIASNAMVSWQLKKHVNRHLNSNFSHDTARNEYKNSVQRLSRKHVNVDEEKKIPIEQRLEASKNRKRPPIGISPSPLNYSTFFNFPLENEKYPQLSEIMGNQLFSKRIPVNESQKALFQVFKSSWKKFAGGESNTQKIQNIASFSQMPKSQLIHSSCKISQLKSISEQKAALLKIKTLNQAYKSPTFMFKDPFYSDILYNANKQIWDSEKKYSLDTIFDLFEEHQHQGLSKNSAFGNICDLLYEPKANNDDDIDTDDSDSIRGALRSAQDRKKQAAMEKKLLEKKRQEEIDNLLNQIRKAQMTIQKLALDQLIEQKSELEKQIKAKLPEIEALKKVVASFVQVERLLPEAEKNLALLSEKVSTLLKQTVFLQTRWESVRSALITQLRVKNFEKQTNDQQFEILQTKISSLQNESQDMTSTIAKRTRQLSKKRKQLESMNQTIDRSFYTHRILDTVRNIKHQEQEIAKIRQDIEKVGKSLYSTSDNLHDLKNSIDDTIWVDTEKSLTSKSARQLTTTSTWGRRNKIDPSQAYRLNDKQDYTAVYKYWARILHNFDQMSQSAKETGRFTNSVADLKARIRLLETEKHQFNSNKILRDLAQLMNENSQLLQSLSAKGVSIPKDISRQFSTLSTSAKTLLAQSVS